MKAGAWKRTNANVDRVLELFESGLTCLAIAPMVGANKQTIQSVVKAAGLDTRKNMRRVLAKAKQVYSDETVQELVQAGLRGDLRTESVRIGVDVRAAYAITRRRGLILGFRKKITDPSIKKLICNLYEIGMPTREITARAHCSQGTVMKVISDSGLPRRRPGAIGKSRRKTRDDGIGSKMGA